MFPAFTLSLPLDELSLVKLAISNALARGYSLCHQVPSLALALARLVLVKEGKKLLSAQGEKTLSPSGNSSLLPPVVVKSVRHWLSVSATGTGLDPQSGGCLVRVVCEQVEAVRWMDTANIDPFLLDFVDVSAPPPLLWPSVSPLWSRTAAPSVPSPPSSPHPTKVGTPMAQLRRLRLPSLRTKLPITSLRTTDFALPPPDESEYLFFALGLPLPVIDHAESLFWACGTPLPVTTADESESLEVAILSCHPTLENDAVLALVLASRRELADPWSVGGNCQPLSFGRKNERKSSLWADSTNVLPSVRLPSAFDTWTVTGRPPHILRREERQDECAIASEARFDAWAFNEPRFTRNGDGRRWALPPASPLGEWNETVASVLQNLRLPQASRPLSLRRITVALRGPSRTSLDAARSLGLGSAHVRLLDDESLPLAGDMETTRTATSQFLSFEDAFQPEDSLQYVNNIIASPSTTAPPSFNEIMEYQAKTKRASNLLGLCVSPLEAVPRAPCTTLTSVHTPPPTPKAIVTDFSVSVEPDLESSGQTDPAVAHSRRQRLSARLQALMSSPSIIWEAPRSLLLSRQRASFVAPSPGVRLEVHSAYTTPVAVEARPVIRTAHIKRYQFGPSKTTPSRAPVAAEQDVNWPATPTKPHQAQNVTHPSPTNNHRDEWLPPSPLRRVDRVLRHPLGRTASRQLRDALKLLAAAPIAEVSTPTPKVQSETPTRNTTLPPTPPPTPPSTKVQIKDETAAAFTAPVSEAGHLVPSTSPLRHLKGFRKNSPHTD